MSVSHVVITCRCREDRLNETSLCGVPGHALVPRDPVEPQSLVDAGHEIAEHLSAAMHELMRARAAWVSRGLPAEGYASSWATWFDAKAREIAVQRQAIQRWTGAARKVADRRTADNSPDTTGRSRDRETGDLGPVLDGDENTRS